MTEGEVKNWLKRAFYAEKKKNALEALAKRYRERAEGVQINGAGGGTRSTENKTENAFFKLADVEGKLEQEIESLYSIEKEISDVISKLGDDDLESILINRFLNYMTIEETAERMNYSTRTVKNKQKEAISKLCPLLPCFALLDVL